MTSQHTWLVSGSALLVGALLAACTSSASSPSASGSTSAPQVAGAQATATQLVPTAQAVATQAAPTVQALATQVAPTLTALNNASPVQVTAVRTATDDASVSLRNNGSSAVDVSRWTLRVGSTSVELPSNSAVAPGGTVTVHAGMGNSTATDIYLGQSGQALAGALQPGAAVELVDASGKVVSQFTIPGR